MDSRNFELKLEEMELLIKLKNVRVRSNSGYVYASFKVNDVIDEEIVRVAREIIQSAECAVTTIDEEEEIARRMAR